MRLLAPVSFFARQHLRLSITLGFALTLLSFSGPALADDDPFDLESSSWMSFERYKEKPSTWMAPEVRNEAAQQPIVATAPTLPPDMPQITPPAHEVVPPVMPGLNKGFDVQVNSTADDDKMPDFSPTKPDTPPGVQIESKNWKDAVETARHKDMAGEDDRVSHGVRFSYLPNLPTAPKPKVAAVKAPAKKIETAQAKPAPAPAVVAPPPTVDPAVCAALDAYKKRQLAAIESDRRTLTALQNAIAQLGLQKQLDFLPGVGGTLTTQTAGGPNVDMTASTPSGKN